MEYWSQQLWDQRRYIPFWKTVRQNFSKKWFPRDSFRGFFLYSKLSFPHFLFDIPSSVRQKLFKFWFPWGTISWPTLRVENWPTPFLGYENWPTKNLKLAYTTLCVGQLQVWGLKIGLQKFEVGLHHFMCRPTSILVVENWPTKTWNLPTNPEYWS